MLIYVKVVFLKLINILLRVFGYTRVYDIQNKKDITILYYLLRYTTKLNVPIVVDFVYPKLGVCTFNKGQYIRYVCYNEKLSKIEKKKYKICSNNYNSIKKIELLYCHDKDELKLDVTESKNNFYDINFFTDPFDMITFYRLYTGDSLILPNIEDEFISVLLTRENFNDNLLESVTTYEEIYPCASIENAHHRIS